MSRFVELTDSEESLLAKIAEKAIYLDWNVAFNGKSYGNKHLERVNKIILFLLQEEEANDFLALAGAWVHDTILAVELDNNPENIYAYTLTFLNQFIDLNFEQKEKIARDVSSHESGQAESIEARLIHDADAIDKSGMLGVIRHIWKMTNMIHNRELNLSSDVEELRLHLSERETKTMTFLAQQIVASLNKSQLDFFEHPECKSIVLFISRLSKRGLTSDQIAGILIQNYNYQFISTLEAQLNCEFLSNTGGTVAKT